MESADELDALFGGAPGAGLGAALQGAAQYASQRDAMLLKLPGFMSLGAASLPNMDAGDDASLARASATIAAKDGSAETNARMVQWSDGSWSLVIGRAVFAATLQPTAPQEHLHVLPSDVDAPAVVRARISGRVALSAPLAGDESHRRLLASSGTADAGAGAMRVRIAPATDDPEREMQALVRLEQEKARQRRKEEARRRAQTQRGLAAVAKDGLSARFLEEEDDEASARGEDDYDSDFIDDSEQPLANDSDSGSESGSESEVEVEKKPARRRTMIVDDDE